MSQINFMNLRGRARTQNRNFTRSLVISYTKHVTPKLNISQPVVIPEQKNQEVKPEIKPEVKVEVKPEIKSEENIKLNIETKIENAAIQNNNNIDTEIIKVKPNNENIKHTTRQKLEQVVEPIAQVVAPVVAVEPVIDIESLKDENVLNKNGEINDIIDGFMCWFDSKDVNSFQSSSIACNPSKKDDINIWKDKSRKANNMNKYEASIKPLFTGFDTDRKLSSIFFNVYKKHGLEMNFSRYSSDFNSSQNYTQFIVFKYENSSNDATIWSSNNGDFTIAIDGKTKELKVSTPKKNRNALLYNVSTNIIIQRGKCNMLTIIYDGSKETNASKFILRFNNENVKLQFNDNNMIISSSTENITKFALGMNVFAGDRSDWYSGFINEILLYKKSLNLKSCNQIETYLKTKWDL